MKLIRYFDGFLKDVVNLDQTRLNQLDARVRAIVKYLGTDSVIGPMYKDYVPQGSWPHETIINPLPNDEFDADFLLLLEENTDWSKTPKKYLSQLRAAFKRSSTYQDKILKKNRCGRVRYANECHIDVVPYLMLIDGRQVIVNFAEDKFEDTNPQGFTDWMKEKDDFANGNLRKVIRLAKYLRDYKNRFSCPSVILTTLLGERVQAFDKDSRYSDVPTTLVNLLADLDSWLTLYPTMPVIEDPSCPGTTFNHRWDQDQYANFRTWISFYAARVAEAYNEPDKATSLETWQKVFGPDFRQPVVQAAAALLTKTSAKALDRRAPLEEFIEEKAFPRVGGYRARIECSVEKLAGFRHGPLRNLRSVGKGRKLRFKVNTDVPEPFELYWKVRNKGAEAEQVGDLRGQLILDNGALSRVENTKYQGRHYVEVYVVKNGRVVASDHHDVLIK